MAVWKEQVAGFEVKIHNVDHPPPHCHVYLDGRDARVELRTLEILNPPPHSLPPALRRGLRERQEELLAAWENVIIPPARRSR